LSDLSVHTANVNENRTLS